MADCLTD